MAGSKGIPGLAVAMATAGGFLVYVGVRNVPLAEGLRAMAKGKVPEARPKKVVELPAEYTKRTWTPGKDVQGLNPGGPTIGGGRVRGAQIVGAAMQYKGEPYFWGGHTPTKYGGKGMDCSGFVTWVLHHDLGINLPNNTHTHTTQFINWNEGSVTVSFSAMQPGDLVCWQQHIGIAISNTDMIHAPTAGDVIKIGRVWTSPEKPVIRRVK